MTSRSAAPFSDAAVKAKTGRDWAEWCALLDGRNAAALAHAEIVRIVWPLHDGGGWWSQAVTVGYERLRGKRETFGRSDGGFSASASKTVALDRERVCEWIGSATQRRRWAPAGLKAVASTSARMLRFTGADGSRIGVYLEPKDDRRTIVAVEVAKLADAKAVAAAKAIWKPALEKLHRLVEAQNAKETLR